MPSESKAQGENGTSLISSVEEPDDLFLTGAEIQADEVIYQSAVSALNNGLFENAIRLFELTIKLNPNHAGAHLDLGRAYFHVKRFTDARSEFLGVQTQNPPPDASAVINQYLAQIEQLELTTTNQHLYIQTSLGYDSNINSAMGQSEINIPAFGNIPFTLNSNNQQLTDNYLHLSIGIDGTYTLSEQLMGFWSGSASRRNNLRHSDLDGFSPDISTGVIFAKENYFIRSGLSLNRYYVAGKRNRDVYGVNSDAYFQATPQQRVGIFLQYGVYVFRDVVPSNPPVLPNENITQITAGAVLSHSLDKDKDFSLIGYVGHESAATRTDGNNSFVGARGSWSQRLGDRLTHILGGL
jgi:tetratricopeptide (TPR) repeat protein